MGTQPPGPAQLPGEPQAAPDLVKSFDEVQAAMGKLYRRLNMQDPQSPVLDALHQGMKLVGEIERHATGQGGYEGDPLAEMSAPAGPGEVDAGMEGAEGGLVPPATEAAGAGMMPPPGLAPGMNPMEDAAAGLQQDILQKKQGGGY